MFCRCGIREGRYLPTFPANSVNYRGEPEGVESKIVRVLAARPLGNSASPPPLRWWLNGFLADDGDSNVNLARKPLNQPGQARWRGDLQSLRVPTARLGWNLALPESCGGDSETCSRLLRY